MTRLSALPDVATVALTNNLPSAGARGLLFHVVGTPEVPVKDAPHTVAYIVSPDQKHYRIVSAGSDSIFDWDSRTIKTPANEESPSVVYRDRLEDDIIYQDASFLQLPVQAKQDEDH